MDNFHLAVIIISLIVCYKFGDWRNWEKYYSTILFFILGDFIYGLLFHNNMLWLYVSSMLNHTLVDMIIAITVFPATVMVFIPNYPKGFAKQVVYLLFWALFYSVIEYTSYRLGAFTYDNGWSLYYSSVFCLIMFLLIYLHYKKPFSAWLGALALLIICIVYFDVDIIGLI